VLVKNVHLNVVENVGHPTLNVDLMNADLLLINVHHLYLHLFLLQHQLLHLAVQILRLSVEQHVLVKSVHLNVVENVGHLTLNVDLMNADL